MATDKYDLHTIDYSVQGWDAIMTADMEKLDAVIPTRILGTLGETVVAYQALYFKSDGKWYKAQADGTKQPCLGLAVEGGDDTDGIRIHRMGEITNASWAWGTVGGPIYLDAATAGSMTQTMPAENRQIVGYALSATKMVVLMMIPIGMPLANGQQVVTKSLTELTTIAAAATTTTTIAIPANVIVKAVSVRVTTVIPTAATFTVIGNTTTTVFNTAAVSSAANSTDKGNLNTPYNNVAAQTIRITPNASPADNTGRVRVTIWYEDSIPPTS